MSYFLLLIVLTNQLYCQCVFTVYTASVHKNGMCHEFPQDNPLAPADSLHVAVPHLLRPLFRVFLKRWSYSSSWSLTGLRKCARFLWFAYIIMHRAVMCEAESEFHVFEMGPNASCWGLMMINECTIQPLQKSLYNSWKASLPFSSLLQLWVPMFSHWFYSSEQSFTFSFLEPLWLTQGIILMK